jgi:hypothetical protein
MDTMYSDSFESSRLSKSTINLQPGNSQIIYQVQIMQSKELKIEAVLENYNLLPNDSFLLGEEIRVTGGTGNYHFRWFSNNYQFITDKPTVIVSPTETTKYILTVEDDAGCSETTTINVNVIRPITVNAYIQNINCFGKRSGEIKLTLSNGAPPYFVSWEHGDTSSTRSDLSAGIYKVTISDQMGQVEKKEYAITEGSKIEQSVEATICENYYYTLGNNKYNKPGYYTDTLISKKGCDSIIHLTLLINETYSDTTYASICENTTYSFFQQSLDQSGWYENKMVSLTTCDSIHHLYLQVNPIYNNTKVASICIGDRYHFGDQYLTESGEYQKVFTTNLGCDSILQLNLTVNQPYFDTIRATLCEGESYHFGDDNLKSSGIYQLTNLSRTGCDSIQVLYLQIAPVPFSPIINVVGDTLKCNYPIIQWYKDGIALIGANKPVYIFDHSGNYYVEAINENNCFSFSDTLFVNYLKNEQFESNQSFQIYPNPNTGEFNVAIHAKNKVISIELYTIDGKYLLTKIINNASEQSIIPIHCNGNLKGNYLLFIIDGNDNYSQKITIN